MKGSVYTVAILWLLAAGGGAAFSAAGPPTFFKALTIGAGTEWRFHPLVLDLDRDKHSDLVATARLADDPLRIWLGDGKGGLTAMKPTWTATGYAALATGDINRDRFPDIVASSHFGAVQALLSNGKRGFTEKILRRDDGYVGAQLADLDGDRLLDLVLLGYEKAGIEIFRGDGTGNWSLMRTLPEPKPGETLPGRDVRVADLDHDGHLDLVVAFQRWGIYIYYGDGRGGFSGGPATFQRPEQTPESLALADVNGDGHPDIAVNGHFARDPAHGPDVYLGDGRRGWSASSAGLKVLRAASPALALADLDRDGHLDLVAGGRMAADVQKGFGLFWFKGDGKGGWSLVKDCGLPTEGLALPYGVGLADLDQDRALEIVLLSGGKDGSITVWKRH